MFASVDTFYQQGNVSLVLCNVMLDEGVYILGVIVEEGVYILGVVAYHTLEMNKHNFVCRNDYG